MGGQTHKHQPRKSFHKLPALVKAIYVLLHATERMDKAVAARDIARTQHEAAQTALELARKTGSKVKFCVALEKQCYRAKRRAETRAWQTRKLVERLNEHIDDLRMEALRQADIRVVSMSKKLNKAMVIVKHNGKSETRHLRLIGNKWMGQGIAGGAQVAYPVALVAGHLTVLERDSERRDRIVYAPETTVAA